MSAAPSHLYHDANLVGSTFSELDAREYLKTREKNTHEEVRLLQHKKRIDRERSVAERKHRHETFLVKSSMREIITKTPSLNVSLEAVVTGKDKSDGKTEAEVYHHHHQQRRSKRSKSLPTLPGTIKLATNRPRSLHTSSSSKKSIITRPSTWSHCPSSAVNNRHSNFQKRRVDHITRSLSNLYKRINTRHLQYNATREEDDEKNKSDKIIKFDELSKKNKESLLKAKVVLKNSKYRDRIQAELPDSDPVSQMRLLSWLAQSPEDEFDDVSVYDDNDDFAIDSQSLRLGESAMGDVANDEAVSPLPDDTASSVNFDMSKLTISKRVTFPHIHPYSEKPITSNKEETNSMLSSYYRTITF